MQFLYSKFVVIALVQENCIKIFVELLLIQVKKFHVSQDSEDSVTKLYSVDIRYWQ